MKVILAAMLFCSMPAFVATSRAALTWENVRQEAKAVAGNEDIPVAFRFTNSGDAPVTVMLLQPSCSCITADLAKKTYGPRESGRIEAHFDARNRVGIFEHQIVVVTDETRDARTTLTLRVNIAEVVRCEPRMLTWQIGEPAMERSLEVEIIDPQWKAARFDQPVPGGAGFTVRIVAGEAGRKYRLYIKPEATTAAAIIPVRCKLVVDASRTYTFDVFAVLK